MRGRRTHGSFLVLGDHDGHQSTNATLLQEWRHTSALLRWYAAVHALSGPAAKAHGNSTTLPLRTVQSLPAANAAGALKAPQTSRSSDSPSHNNTHSLGAACAGSVQPRAAPVGRQLLLRELRLSGTVLICCQARVVTAGDRPGQGGGGAAAVGADVGGE